MVCNYEVLIVVKVVVTGTRKICGEPKRVTIGNVGERVDKIRPYFHCLIWSWETIGWQYELVI